MATLRDPAVIGDYELWAEVGVGATGSVWKAYRRGPTSEVVAVKRLRSGVEPPSGSTRAVDRARLRWEAAILARLDHPHIVRLVEVLDDGPGLAIAMQFAAGGSLRALLTERGQLTAGETVAIAGPIADALGSAHRQGLVHGDVKPANVLFDAAGTPLLADFDAARVLGRLSGDPVAGTADYMAPETLGGAAPHRRSDVYSLSVVCFEALVGYLPCTGALPMVRRPGRGRDDGAGLAWPQLSDVPRALAAVIERGMADNPAHRFGSADVFARALRDAAPREAVRLHGIAATATSAGADDPPERSTQRFGPQPPAAATPRRRLRRAVAVMLGIAAAGLLVVGLRSLGLG